MLSFNFFSSSSLSVSFFCRLTGKNVNHWDNKMLARWKSLLRLPVVEQNFAAANFVVSMKQNEHVSKFAEQHFCSILPPCSRFFDNFLLFPARGVGGWRKMDKIYFFNSFFPSSDADCWAMNFSSPCYASSHCLMCMCWAEPTKIPKILNYMTQISRLAACYRMHVGGEIRLLLL